MTLCGEDVWAAAAGIVALSVGSAVVNIGLKCARRRAARPRLCGRARRPEGANAGVGVFSIRAHRIRLRRREGLQVPPSARASALTVSGRSTGSARLGPGGWPSQVRIEITRIENRLRASGGGSAHQGAAEPVALLRPDRHAGSARTASWERASATRRPAATSSRRPTIGAARGEPQ